MKIVMVFGTFDGVHQGHEYLLGEAKKLGDRLVVCIARDATVEQINGRRPRRPEIERREALAQDRYVDQVVYGDRQLGSYRIVEEIDPDIIALGYDQTELKADLTRWISVHDKSIQLVDIAAHHPELYKSSIVNKIAGNRPGRPSA